MHQADRPYALYSATIRLQSISVGRHHWKRAAAYSSVWALIPGLVAVPLMIIRTALEDRTLQADVPGYLGFVQEVHYRLVPGIWQRRR